MIEGHFDGTAQRADINCGVGVIIRDSQEGIFQIMWNCDKRSNTRAELLAIWILLWTTKHFYIPISKIKGDLEVIVNWINQRRGLQVVALDSWKQKVINLLNHFCQVQIEHIRR